MISRIRHTLDEVSEMTGISSRTIRYYIQEGIVDTPDGAGRGAHYTRRHLLQLIHVSELRQKGLSLQRIREVVRGDGKPDSTPQRRNAGVEVWTRLHLGEGIELNIQPGLANLAPEQLERLRTRVLQALEEITPTQE